MWFNRKLTINHAFYGITNSSFMFLPVRTILTNDYGTTYGYPIGDMAPQGYTMPMKVAFSIDSSNFEVQVKGAGYFMVYCPPDYTPYTNFLWINNMPTYVLVSFPTRAQRNIIFYLGGDGALALISGVKRTTG